MPDERGGAAGAQALTQLIAGAHPVVALAATERLARINELALNLGANSSPVLAAALGDPARPDEVRSAILQLVGAQRLLALRPAIVPLAAPGNALEADAVEALALLDGGVASESADALLQRADPRVRVAALRHLEGASAGPRLASLVRSDPAASVRAAAATALLERGAAGAEDDATPALFDRDPTVRAAAAEGFGRLGERAVTRLRQLALARQADDARGPIAALSLAGPSGAEALREISTTHPDEPTRRLAAFALGHVPSHDRGLPTQPPNGATEAAGPAGR
jgi:HEAT repeat protein